MTSQANLPDKTQIRKAITQAKFHFTKCLARLPMDEWTKSDLRIQYEIMHDPDVLAVLEKSRRESKGGGE